MFVKDLLKELDYLSPNITLYHKGSLSHDSWMSGLLSLFSFILFILLAIYYSLDLLKRQNPKSYYYNRFTEDAGIIPINSTSLFHYISISNVNDFYEEKKFDFESFRIIGLDIYYENYINDKNLYNYNHWLYGKCNKENDIKNIEHLINQKYFTDFACIRKYYDSKSGKYYNTNEEGFIWPVMAHGLNNPKKKYYSVFIEKCQQKSLDEILGKEYLCKNDVEMEELFNGYYAFHFNFIDQFADVLNYRNPNIIFLTRIENTIVKDNYSVNHLNFDPAIIYTYDGVIFDTIKEKQFYSFNRNDAFTYEEKETTIYSIYNFWLKNRMLCYERTYKKIQDIISDIGGVSEFITVVATFFNCFFNKYTTMINIEKLINPYLRKNENGRNSKIELTNIEINEINKTNFNKNNNNKNSFINGQITEKQKLSNSSPNINTDININNKIYENQEKYKFEDSVIINKKNEINYNNDVKEKEKFDFWSFRLYKLTCGKQYNYFKLYEDFRIKMISEEHIIKNHINICNLLKANKINELDKNNYSLQDLINKG